MESIVVSLLGKYLDLFIKGFNKDQLNISALQGKVELKNVELVNSSVQEMLLIPTSLLVTRATCNELLLQLPKLTEIKKRPLVLGIDRVDVSLEEPDEVPPMPTKLREFFASKKKADPSKKKKDRDDIARSMNYSVKSLVLRMKLKNNPHVLTVEVKDFSLSTCTPAGQVTDEVQNARLVAPDNTETMFKTGNIGSVTVSVGEGDQRIVILDGMPAKLNMNTVVSSDLGLPLKTAFEVTLGKFNILLQRGTFLRHYHFIKDLNACLDRFIVVEDAVDENDEKKLAKQLSNAEKVEFDLQINEWSIGVQDDKVGDIFGVRGEKLRICGSPPRGVHEQDGSKYAVSSVALFMSSLALQHFEVGGAPGKQLVASSRDNPADLSNVFEFEARTKRIDTKTTPKFAFKFFLNRLAFLLDQNLLARLYNLLNLAKDHEELKVDLSGLPEKAKAVKEKIKARMEHSLDELYQAADATVEIQDVQVTIPADASLEDPSMKDMGILVGAKKLALRNSPGWTAVPFVADGRTLLSQHQADVVPPVHLLAAKNAGVAAGSRASQGPPPVRRPAPPPGSQGALGGEGSKWQVGIEGFSFGLTRGNSKEPYLYVTKPVDLILYGRAVKQKPPHVEVSVHATAPELSITPEVINYVSASWHSYAQWARNLLSLGESKEEAKVSVKEKLSQLKEGMESMEDSVLKRVLESATNEDYSGAVVESLSVVTGLVYFKFDGGSAKFALEKSEKDDNCSFARFDSFQIAAELGGAGQMFVMQLGTVTATNLHYKTLPVVLDLHPVRAQSSSVASLGRAGNSSVTIAVRRPGKQLGVPTVVEVGLSNVAVTSIGKEPLSPMELIGEVTKYAETAGTGLKEAADVAKKADLKQKGKKILDHLNLHWRFKLGECSFVHRDHDAPEDSTMFRGIASVGMIDWNSLEKGFADVETQLISAKLAAAAAEGEKEELKANIRVLQDTILETMKQVEAKSNDFLIVNQKLMEERMKMQDMMETIDRLKAQVASKSGPPPPVNRANK